MRSECVHEIIYILVEENDLQDVSERSPENKGRKAEMKRLGREKQCPWKVSVDARDIPFGYSEDKHLALAGTIATHLQIGGTIRVMACHESPVGQETKCIGWLVNQLGPGNNIALRIQMMDYDLSGVEVFGDQHQTFEETLP